MHVGTYVKGKTIILYESFVEELQNGKVIKKFVCT